MFADSFFLSFSGLKSPPDATGSGGGEAAKGYTPVATESMRNKLMGKGLQRARGADDVVKQDSGLRRQIADGG